MEKDLYKVGEDYVEARIIESLSDLLLSLTLWKGGYWELCWKGFQFSKSINECDNNS